MTTPILAAALIRSLEGLRLTAYRDSGGVLTIGYGHTGKDVTEGLTITLDRAQELFNLDAAPLLTIVRGMNPVAGAALVSFGYNCGALALLRLLRGEISMQTYGRRDKSGKELPGLAARRDLEAALWEAGR